MMRLLLPGSLCFVLVTLTNAARSMQDLILVVNINKIDEGMVGYFQCLHRHSRRPAKVYSWFFGDKELPMARKGRTYVAESATNHQLYVTNASTSDSGEYTCVANVKGRMANASNYLSVYCKKKLNVVSVSLMSLSISACLSVALLSWISSNIALTIVVRSNYNKTNASH
jgi:hypothetical protein